MGIGEDKAFVVDDINTLKRKTISLLEKAEDTQKELNRELDELLGVLNTIPSNLLDHQLKDDVSSLRESVNSSEYSEYKKQLKKSLDRIKTEIPSADKKYAKDIQKICTSLNQTNAKIKDLTALIPKVNENTSIKSFEKELNSCLEKWENHNKAAVKELTELIKNMKGEENEPSKSSIDPVNLSTGNFYYNKSDLKIAGEPILDINRFYNAIEAREGSLGKGWMHPYEVRLVIEEATVTVLLEDGKEEIFEIKKDGSCYSNQTRSRLKQESNGYCYQKQDKSEYRFDAEGACKSYQDAEKNSLEYRYEDGLLKRVVRTKDQVFLAFFYDEKKKISKISDHTGRSVEYFYDEAGELLCSVKNVLGETCCYGYDETGNLSVITNEEGNRLVTTKYDEEHRAKEQEFPDGSGMSFFYDEEKGEVLLSERNGSKTIYCHNEKYHNIKVLYEDGTEEKDSYNGKGQLLTHKDVLGRTTRYAYDGKGNLTQVIDPFGNKTNATYNRENKLVTFSLNGKEKVKNTYDEKGNLIKSTDALGRSTEYFYGANGKEEKIKLADGSFLQFAYDEKGNRTALTDAFGISIQYFYDDLNRMIEEKKPEKGSTRYTYDSLDRIVSIEEENGTVTTYEYYKNGKLAKAKQGALSVHADYNEIGCLKSKTDANGNTTEYTYNEMWKIKEIRYPNGGRMQFSYNPKGLLERRTDPLGHITNYTYDAAGNCIQEETEGIGVVSYTYDVLDRIESYTDADKNTASYQYDEAGNILEIRNAANKKSYYAYDEAGQLIKETNVMGYAYTYGYNELGQQISMQDEEGELLHYDYEKGGRLKGIRYPDGNYEEYFYDTNGRISRVHDREGGTLSCHYDKSGQLTAFVGGDGQTESYTYDTMGNIHTFCDANGKKTTYTYDANGNLTGIQDALNHQTNYRYDAMNQLIEIVRYSSTSKEHGKKICYERDLLGRVTQAVDEAGERETYGYDAADRMIERQDREGNVTKYSYSPGGKLLQIQYADGKSAAYTYNSIGALQKIEDWLGSTEMETDPLGRVKTLRYPNGEQIGYRYGTRGERSEIIYPDGSISKYFYHAGVRLESIQDGRDHISYFYDEKNRLKEKQLPNGVKTNYTYTRQGFLASLESTDANGIMERHTYTYDAMGNRTKIKRERRGLEEESGIYHYAYDALGRLEQVEKNQELLRTYTYDAWGNRQSMTDYSQKQAKTISYHYNEAGQLLKESDGIKELTYCYDKRGNLTGIQKDGARELSCSYGCQNRLKEAVTKDGTAVRYQYHSLGYRIGKTESSKDKPDRTSWYLVDFTRKTQNLLGEKKNKEDIRYIWDGRAAIQKTDSQSNYYLTDELGSPLRFLNEEGSIKESYGYTEFGEELYERNHKEQPFTYTGYQKDHLTGTCFAQAREYHPSLGRFGAEDIIRGSILAPQSLNHYAYCYNNPEKYVDEDGEWATIAIGAGIGFVWGGVSSIIEAKIEGKEINWKQAGIDAAKGAIKGGFAGSGVGVLSSAIADGGVDFIGNIAKQMIVDGKSWKEVNLKKSAKVGISSAVTSAVGNKLCETKFIKGKVMKGEDIRLFKADNDKALKTALDMEKRVAKSKDILKNSLGKEWEERAVNVLTKERETYLKSLKEFAQFNNLRTGEKSVKGWANTIYQEEMYCALQ